MKPINKIVNCEFDKDVVMMMSPGIEMIKPISNDSVHFFLRLNNNYFDLDNSFFYFSFEKISRNERNKYYIYSSESNYSKKKIINNKNFKN